MTLLHQRKSSPYNKEKCKVEETQRERAREKDWTLPNPTVNSLPTLLNSTSTQIECSPPGKVLFKRMLVTFPLFLCGLEQLEAFILKALSLWFSHIYPPPLSLFLSIIQTNMVYLMNIGCDWMKNNECTCACVWVGDTKSKKCECASVNNWWFTLGLCHEYLCHK